MRISDLGRATRPLSGDEIFALVQDGQTRAATLEGIRGGPLASIRDFGALGDGVSDDTDAFVAMHAHLRERQDRDPDFRALILLPPGHYRYRWNRWLWGLRDVAVFGYGATLECINRHDRNFECFPLVTNRNGFQNVAPADQDSSPHVPLAGSLIRSALIGDAGVDLLDPTATASFRPGRLALVMSYDQQFSGYPPNCRYFDFVKIADVAPGRLTFETRLRHNHLDDYPERRDAGIGRARILDVDRDDVRVATRQIICGARFLPNANLADKDAQYVLAQGVMNFTMRDCEAPAFVAALGGDFALENCAIGYCEPDKFVGSLSLQACDIGVLTQATGVEMLSARESCFAAPVNVQARTASFDRCTFAGASHAGEHKSGLDLRGFAPTRLLTVRACTFVGKNGRTDAAIGPIGWRTSDPPSVVFEEPLRLDADGALVMPLDSPQASVLLRSLEPGGLIVVAQESGGVLYADGRAAVVGAITGAGDEVRIAAAWSRRPDPRDYLVAPRVSALSSADNVFVGTPANPPLVLDQSFESGVLRSENYEWRRRSDFESEVCFAPGQLRSIAIDVLKPHGGDDDAFLRIEQQFPPGGPGDVFVDLRAAGRHDFPDGAANFEAGSFLWSFRLSHSTTPKGAAAAPKGTREQMAIYCVRIHTSNPFRLL